MQQSAGDWLTNDYTMLQQVSHDVKQLSTGWLQKIWQQDLNAKQSLVMLQQQE